jgi:hypothetical protein
VVDRDDVEAAFSRALHALFAGAGGDHHMLAPLKEPLNQPPDAGVIVYV